MSKLLKRYSVCYHSYDVCLYTNSKRHEMLQEFLENCYTSGLKPWIVDVRDVARAHVRAAEVALRFHTPPLLGVVLQPAAWHWSQLHMYLTAWASSSAQRARAM